MAANLSYHSNVHLQSHQIGPHCDVASVPCQRLLKARDMFETVELAPPDAILGLTDAYRADTNPEKINLGVGVYQDESGKTPVLKSVVEATQRLAANLSTKSYLPITGAANYGAAVQQLLFGNGHEVIASGRAVSAHTPGGTGALRVTADFLSNNLPQASIWFTDPTWANHGAIFGAAGVASNTIPYFDPKTNGLAFDAMVDGIKQIPAGDAVLLHGCCHNPTGIDPTSEQWKTIADLVYERGLLPILDFAYQGFGVSVQEDAAGLREFARPGAKLIVCNSFSKNFGLYRERVGGVTFVSKDSDQRATVESQVKRCIRSNYSNPPAHGAELVTTILGDAELTTLWETEVADMRERIHKMRTLLVDQLVAAGAVGDYSFIAKQSGMFSFSGLSREHVARLKDDFSIYIVGSGRINVAGITPGNVARLCESIATVTA